MTKAEEVHRQIDEFVAGGMQKADAFRRLSEETGKPVKSLQGQYYSRIPEDGKRREYSPSEARDHNC